MESLQLDSVLKIELYSGLKSFAYVFSSKSGCTDQIHSIKLVEGAKPVKEKPYRLHPEKLKRVENEIEELLKLEIIEESNPEWTAPIVIVKKADNSDRLCTDFLKLKSLSCSDSFSMPRVEDLVDKVGEAKFLSKLEMTKGIWQIKLEESSVPLTGFMTPNSHYTYINGNL